MGVVRLGLGGGGEEGAGLGDVGGNRRLPADQCPDVAAESVEEVPAPEQGRRGVAGAGLEARSVELESVLTSSIELTQVAGAALGLGVQRRVGSDLVVVQGRGHRVPGGGAGDEVAECEVQLIFVERLRLGHRRQSRYRQRQRELVAPSGRCRTSS